MPDPDSGDFRFNIYFRIAENKNASLTLIQGMVSVLIWKSLESGSGKFSHALKIRAIDSSHEIKTLQSKCFHIIFMEISFNFNAYGYFTYKL